MKMTGHFLFGEYAEKKEVKNQKLKVESWEPKNKSGSLRDPVNRFIHVVFTLSNGKHLALSDLRKFAKVTLIKTGKLSEDPDLKNLGPEPLGKNFSAKIFTERLRLRSNGKIKQVLMDQTVLAGIGNIYSDEMLWRGGVHPLAKVKDIPTPKLTLMYSAMKKILGRSLKIGGDSESDYRDITGQPGNFQNETKAYAHKGEKCAKLDCDGVIQRIKVGGRSAHFCPKHQKKYGV